MAAGSATNKIERLTGKGGLPWIRLTHVSGYSVVVSEYGAQVVSWLSPSQRELLFMSEAATFEPGKAIRGGIPVVFPQFGKGVLPAHGFARTSMWKPVREQVSVNGAVSITLRLVADTTTEELWPYSFMIELDVVLTETLLTTFRVENIGSVPFQYTSALHTYFRTDDITEVELRGLTGIEYVDLLNQRKMSVESSGALTFRGPIDRAYRDSPQVLSLYSKNDGSRFTITKEGFSDTVVWNPWEQGARAIPDLLPAEYAQMVCVESGSVLSPIIVQPGDMHTSAQILRAE